MARKMRFHDAAKRIGAAVGKADRTAHKTAHKVVKASKLAKGELADIKKKVDALAKQLQKTTKRLQHALK